MYTGWNLDFRKFFVYLKDKYKVSKAFLFIGKKDSNTKLYSYLEKSGFKLIYKPAVSYYDENNVEQIKGNVDAELVLHAMIEYPSYDKAIIVSGDGDYFCLIEYLEKQGKLKHVAIPNKFRYSKLFKKFRKYFFYVSEQKNKLEKK